MGLHLDESDASAQRTRRRRRCDDTRSHQNDVSSFSHNIDLSFDCVVAAAHGADPPCPLFSPFCKGSDGELPAATEQEQLTTADSGDLKSSFRVCCPKLTLKRGAHSIRKLLKGMLEPRFRQMWRGHSRIFEKRFVTGLSGRRRKKRRIHRTFSRVLPRFVSCRLTPSLAAARGPCEPRRCSVRAHERRI